ncbi:MAG: hypothetical protein HOV79_18440 [Hamadaea sp.]|nr:hypothetical protein [Hamadaea sp.]
MQWISYVVGGLALAVSAAFGGFAPIENPEPVLKAGQVDAGKPWNVTILRARLVKDLEPAARLQDKNNHWLAVVADIEITDVESHSDIRDILLVPKAEGLVLGERTSTTKEYRAYEVIVTSDGTRVESLHPGLKETVAFLWEQKGDVVPTEVEIQIMGMTWRKDSLTGVMGWHDLAPRATLTVPVEDKRNG